MSLFALELPPFLLLFIGAALAACTRGHLQKVIVVLTPIISFLNFYQLPTDYSLIQNVHGYHLELAYSDKLSRLFGYLFHLAALIGVIFSLQVKDTVQHVSALTYAASALGAVFAGDWITLFIFWEGLAITSVFLIWARRTERSYRSGMRYLIMQVLSGVLLLAGALFLQKAGMPGKITSLSLTDNFSQFSTIGTWLIFLAFAIKAGFPLFHTWITDSYPEATATGAVFLTSFTSKVAVFMFAKVFAGTELLIIIGLVMACLPIFYAVIENDLRRVLTYSMINQIGFMICGIGVGTELAINGAVATAFNHVIYKGLLMMSMGAVLYRVGHVNGSDLGGLYRSMPVTTICCIIGAASISAFPLFSGFVSKAIIMGEMLYQGHTVGWLLLLFAAAGVFHHAGIKIPYFAFFGHDSGLKVKEAPINMLIAMLLSSAVCIGIGLNPQWLYQLLPFEMNYSPYDLTHVVTQLQLLFFSALAFVVLNLKGIYPPELRSTNLDTDWFFRRLFPAMYATLQDAIRSLLTGIGNLTTTYWQWQTQALKKSSGPNGILSRGWGANNMIFIVILLLGALLLFDF